MVTSFALKVVSATEVELNTEFSPVENLSHWIVTGDGEDVGPVCDLIRVNRENVMAIDVNSVGSCCTSC